MKTCGSKKPSTSKDTSMIMRNPWPEYTCIKGGDLIVLAGILIVAIMLRRLLVSTIFHIVHH